MKTSSPCSWKCPSALKSREESAADPSSNGRVRAQAVLLGVYVAYLLLFALAPFTPAVDASAPLMELYKRKFEGLAGISRVTAWDIWTNLLLFIPYGFLIVARPAISAYRWWGKLLAASVSAAVLSGAVELGQLLLPRHPSLADIACNTLGGTVGALLRIIFAASGIMRYQPSVLQHRTALALILAGYLLALSAAFSLPLPLSWDFINWNPTFHLQVGNEGSLGRAWHGTIYLVALYDRALSGREVWLNFAAGPFVSSTQSRAREGLILFYDFSEGAGSVVHDRAGLGAPAHLRIHDPWRVQWLTPNGLALREDTVIASQEPPIKLSTWRFSARSELSVEAWIAPGNLSQSGPARIVSYSKDPYQRNFTLGQQAREIIFRLRTPSSGSNGIDPELRTTDGPLDHAVQHLLVTYHDGRETLYVNGVERANLLLRPTALIEVIRGLLGQEFTWPLRSVFVFPLGILTYLCFSAWRPSKPVVGSSLVAALAGIAFVESIRLLTLKTPFDPFFVLVGAATVLASILVAPGFVNVPRDTQPYRGSFTNIQ